MATGRTAGLQYLEYEIARCERRIRKIRENPDPKKPKSNLVLYEMERDFRLEQMEGYRAGKPFGVAGTAGLTRALGLVLWDAIMAADRTHGEAARRYFDIIRREGMAEHTCDRTIIIVPMVLKGDFPEPNILLTTNQECLPIHLAYSLIARLLDVPIFMLDRHFDAYGRVQDEEKLKYVRNQIEKFIEYAEATVPGCKYHEDKHIELQYYDRLFQEQHRELYKLKKTVPSPVGGRDAFREMRLPSFYPSPAKAVEYMRMYVEEIADKAAKGEGVVDGEEKLRLLWSVSGPFYSDPFTWLEKQGIAVPAAEMTSYNGWCSGREPIYGDRWKGRKLSPLEEDARHLDFVWGRNGDWWVQAHIDTCKDLGLHGIIYFLQWGCSVSNNLGRLVAETAERELGIPTLLVEGRMLDDSVFDEKDFFGRLEDFVAICMERQQGRSSSGIYQE